MSEEESRLLFSSGSDSGNAKNDPDPVASKCVAVGKKSAKQHKPNAKTKASIRALMQKLEQQDYRCALSGVHLTPSNAALDHIVPVSEGGTDDVENLQWLDKIVNRAKSTLSQDEFIEMCRRVAAYTR